jgi:hypothetical protein
VDEDCRMEEGYHCVSVGMRSVCSL